MTAHGDPDRGEWRPDYDQSSEAHSERLSDERAVDEFEQRLREVQQKSGSLFEEFAAQWIRRTGITIEQKRLERID